MVITAVHGVSVWPLLQCMVYLCGHYCSAWCICVAITAVHGVSLRSLLQCMGIYVVITAVHGVSVWPLLQCMVYLCGQYCSAWCICVVITAVNSVSV